MRSPNQISEHKTEVSGATEAHEEGLMEGCNRPWDIGGRGLSSARELVQEAERVREELNQAHSELNQAHSEEDFEEYERLLGVYESLLWVLEVDEVSLNGEETRYKIEGGEELVA